MQVSNRRYDIDWLRVIAIGLLIVYHVAIGFQPWGIMIGFITNQPSWPGLWVPMMLLNVWRIPLLFFVSGMGVYFAMQNRNAPQLIMERIRRILVPFLFGVFCIVPLHVYLWQYYYHFPPSYLADPGHLWFLGNIFVYTLLFLPVFFWLKKNEGHRKVIQLRRWLGSPLGLLTVLVFFVAEAWLVDPAVYEQYAMTWHGFFLGMVAFFFGCMLMMNGTVFWSMLLRSRWLLLLIAVLFFTWRFLQPRMQVPHYQVAMESVAWIFTILAFGYKHLNRPGKTLAYLSSAAYPVYITHMVFLYLSNILINPLNIDVRIKFMMVVLFTATGCLVFYEWVIRRSRFLRPLFGLKKKE